MNSKAAKDRSFMDTLVALFKNAWLKRGVALLCWGYTGLLIWIAWLNGACFLEYENPTSLFVVYVFVNIAALGLLIYTRRQVITQVNVMIMPPVVFATFLLAFGNWYMILPPLAVIIAMFFICTANETLKTVLGTMYLLMYVIGGAAYITITLLMGKMTVTGVDLDLRDRSYEELSSDGQYRIVRYVDKPTGERRTASYYVEDVSKDTDIPFGIAKRVLGSGWIVTAKYTGKSDDPVSWVTRMVDGKKVEMISVEGTLKENPYLVAEISEAEATEESSVPITLYKGTEDASAQASSSETKTAE